MSAAKAPARIDTRAILDFWFSGPTTLAGWFQRSDAFDALIRSKFSAAVSSARASASAPSPTDAQSTLALILCVDQFPRNLFRGSSEAFSSDRMARQLATEAIARGFDRQVPLVQQVFFYVPLEHGEDLLAQVAAVSLFEGLVQRVDAAIAAGAAGKLSDEEAGFVRFGLKSAVQHRDVVLRFGRFPGRNEALGRSSTEEEIEFLRVHGGF